MSDHFRELLKTIGSGTHTGKNLTRQEATAAMRMMLLGEATPAQIGAFFIAHRIKRPTGEELAGMLDTYNELGPKLKSQPSMGRVTVLGCPYDGRSRTAPVTPLTALILATAGVFVVMHGGARMPTKEGVPFIEIWQGLGVEWGRLSLVQVQQVFEHTGLGFVYLPEHFPQADVLVEYRRDIGKRPPLATMELIWVPFVGEVHLAAGYVHPPTEGMFREALKLQGLKNYTTVKGLEGSCDLPRDRTAIIGVSVSSGKNVTFERLLLHPSDYNCGGKEVALGSTAELVEEMQGVLQSKGSELMSAAIWNGGFYLWRCGICSDINEGLSKAESLLSSGEVREKLREIKAKIGEKM
ncbi:MAG: anthranilate phosphoribosyltransferase family protein [Okeania sp. SIO2F4]|uniref:anthranilate phosphoribosyltransferase family protein n=1 Tax=Okeania sp. SIO2F4 TaxID=2607790 RepID=UPI00142C6047|nr:anthranilate phosphoribosyltransferase family protein [Okeania sp. SIO2F4]NES05182.1 anthranilate phosphoribosyltransferase family protein [Okeania sp. SIO2F4]